MKIEEAIEWMEETIQDINELFDQCSTALQEEITEQKEVFELALTALRSMPEAGEPLSLEQLKQMDGKPVWIEDTSCWGLVFIPKAGQFKNSPFVLFRKEGVQFEWHVTDSELTIYSYPPAHIDVKVFCGNWEGEADGYADGELVYDVWRCGDCGHVEETDDPDLLPRFCPRCGRAMTPEAWTELERRLRG